MRDNRARHDAGAVPIVTWERHAGPVLLIVSQITAVRDGLVVDLLRRFGNDYAALDIDVAQGRPKGVAAAGGAGSIAIQLMHLAEPPG